tara:strand:+ start:316 stop:474 length:159 start_codon:yes stop_codon:yes gene_type:complete
MTDRYSIYIRDECKYSDLSEFEFFEMMDNLIIEYYQTGSPDPSEIRTEITGD